MEATIYQLPAKTPVTPEDTFAASLIAQDPDVAARICAALVRSLDAIRAASR